MELVRAPSPSSDDQAIVFGRPSIVLNAAEQIAHVALIEFDEYHNDFKMDVPTDSDLYWYRKSYTPCP